MEAQSRASSLSKHALSTLVCVPGWESRLMFTPALVFARPPWLSFIPHFHPMKMTRQSLALELTMIGWSGTKCMAPKTNLDQSKRTKIKTSWTTESDLWTWHFHELLNLTSELDTFMNCWIWHLTPWWTSDLTSDPNCYTVEDYFLHIIGFLKNLLARFPLHWNT